MEYSAPDILLAVATAVLVIAGSAAVLRGAALGERASGIDLGERVPVRVLLDDGPALALGGGAPGGHGGRLRAEAPRPRAGDRRAPPPGAAAETETPAEEEAGAAASAPVPSSPEAVLNTVDPSGEEAGGSSPGSTGALDSEPAAGPGGPGHPEGSPGGTETDPLRARAADVYRARLAAWFSLRFRVSGSGLSQAALTKLRARATVSLSPDRRVIGYTLSPSGDTAFDAAARATLEGAKGQALPPPPESFPDLLETSISVTFVCKEGRCD